MQLARAHSRRGSWAMGCGPAIAMIVLLLLPQEAGDKHL